MSAQFLHVGIPITQRKPNMTYVDGMKIHMSNPSDYDFSIEYLKFEEGTLFPEIMHHQPHVAYKVDSLEHYLAEADRVLVQPLEIGGGSRIAFIVKDEVIFELLQEGAPAAS